MRDVLNDLYKRCMRSLKLHNFAEAAKLGLETPDIQGEQSPNCWRFFYARTVAEPRLSVPMGCCVWEVFKTCRALVCGCFQTCTQPPPSRLETEMRGNKGKLQGGSMPTYAFWPCASGLTNYGGKTWQPI